MYNAVILLYFVLYGGNIMAKLNFHLHKLEDKEYHTHEHAHLFIPYEGYLVIYIDGIRHDIASNHILFVAPNRVHYCEPNSHVITINIPPTMLKESDVEKLEQCVYMHLNQEMLQVIELIKKEISMNYKSDSIRYLYYYLYEKIIFNNEYKCIKYIKEHFTEEISVSKLADLQNYNVNYFTDWFKSKIGCTPSHYIRSMRIEKAKELLHCKSMRIIDVAVQVGYGNNASFSKAFKEVTKMSPAEYKKEHHNHEGV